MNSEDATISLQNLSLNDLEAIRLLLRGESVIDWYRLHFEDKQEARDFLNVQEVNIDEPEGLARVERVKAAAVSHLRRRYDFPIPKPVENAPILDLLLMASGSGHRQLCACTILKVMHVIHHADARELLFMLPVSNEEVFSLVEQKVYRVIGEMLANGFPIVEFIGGRKNKDSLYTKLMSKPEVTAAQIYDKLRFRVVTRSLDNIFPVLCHMMDHIFPFNFVIPGESSNTLFHFRSYCEKDEHLRGLQQSLQQAGDEEFSHPPDNVFSAPSYRVVHFVVDMPVRLPQSLLSSRPASAELGDVIFVQTEFQVIDQEADRHNEMGAASHSAYKDRQRQAVMRRLKLGMSGRTTQVPASPDEDDTD